MWKDIVIGKGESQCSATKVFDIKGDHSISQNSTSFWISGCLLGAGMTIFKHTSEGKNLQALIDAGASFDQINELLDSFVIRYIDPKKLVELIKRSNEEAFNNGMESKAAQIRAAIGYD